MKTDALISFVLLALAGSVHSVSSQFNYETNNGTIVIYGYSGPGGDVEVPSTMNGLPVTTIGSFAFYYCTSLTGLTIPASVSTIGFSAFSGSTSLTGITIPNSVTYIGSWAFYGCRNLVAVHYLGDCPLIMKRPLDLYPHPLYDSASTAINYYLSGTTGWEASYGGRPTAPWLPEALNSGVETGQFRFTIHWAGDRVVVVDACGDLSSLDWTAVSTNTLTDGLFHFEDPNRVNHAARFYRLRSP